MNDRGKQRRWRGHRPDDPERAVVIALRWLMLASMLLPVAFASLCASATGQGLPLPLASPMAAMAVAASVVCWRRLAQVWHRTPPGDDDQGWPRRWWSEDRPLGPSGGPGGITFDWYTFEREFRAYLGERQGASEREPVAH